MLWWIILHQLTLQKTNTDKEKAQLFAKTNIMFRQTEWNRYRHSRLHTIIFIVGFLCRFECSSSFQTDYTAEKDASNEIKREDEDSRDWKMVALEKHNVLRRRHGVADLHGDVQLDKIAQNYAEKLAANNVFDHSTDNDYGENLMLTTADNKMEAVKDAVDSWYEEIKDYDYKKPGYKEETSHFTEMLWKATTHMGVGIAWNDKEEQFVVVANYKPGGNVEGEYQDNVFPLQQQQQ